MKIKLISSIVRYIPIVRNIYLKKQIINRIQTFINEIDKLKKKPRWSPEWKYWKTNVGIFLEKDFVDGKEKLKKFNNAWLSKTIYTNPDDFDKSYIDCLQDAEIFLKSIIDELENYNYKKPIMLFNISNLQEGWKQKLFLAIVAGLIVTIITFFVFYAEPSLWGTYIIGPKIHITFRENPELIGDKPSIVVDLHNNGGVDLHNIEAELAYICNGDVEPNPFLFGKAKFEKPSYHLLKGEKNFIPFTDENLVGLMKTANKPCADAMMFIIDFDGNRLSRFQTIKYDKIKDTLDLTEIKDLNNFSAFFCLWCDTNLVIHSDEREFPMKKKQLRLSVFDISNPQFMVLSPAGKQRYAFSTTIQSDCCAKEGKTSGEYLKEKINGQFPELGLLEIPPAEYRIDLNTHKLYIEVTRKIA